MRGQWIVRRPLPCASHQLHKLLFYTLPGADINAVVLVSGGMDSAVVLAIAREQGFAVHALSVAYGQRHTSELEAAATLASAQGALAHKTVSVDLRAIGGSALTADIDVPEPGSAGVPVTYVPARNTIMLSIALGWAEVLDAADIFCGVNAGRLFLLPDCRPEFIEAFERLATGHADRRRGADPQPPRPAAISKADIGREGCAGPTFAQTVLLQPPMHRPAFSMHAFPPAELRRAGAPTHAYSAEGPDGVVRR